MRMLHRAHASGNPNSPTRRWRVAGRDLLSCAQQCRPAFGARLMHRVRRPRSDPQRRGDTIEQTAQLLCRFATVEDVKRRAKELGLIEN